MTRLKKKMKETVLFIYWKIYEERVGNCELFYILRRKNNRDIVSAFLSCRSSISLIFYGVDTLFVVLLVILFISIQGFFQWCLYRKKRNASQHIIDLVDGLEETYYIADVLPKPKEFQNKAYCYALKKACKSMNDESVKSQRKSRIIKNMWKVSPMKLKYR